MEALGEVLKETGVLPPDRPKQTESTRNGEQARPQKAMPVILPKYLPSQIIARVLETEIQDEVDHNDYQAIVRHLQAWRRTGAEWDDYRNKMDQTLLEKWGTILKWCRREGFLFGGIKPEKKKMIFTWMQRVKYSGD